LEVIKMTLKEAYIYMFATLDAYWDNAHDKDLGGILSGLSLWSPLSGNERTADPAAWEDWRTAVRKVTEKDSLDNSESLKAAFYLLKLYTQQGFTLDKPIRYLEDKLAAQIKASNTWRVRSPD
jgi:hypothetical protein